MLTKLSRSALGVPAGILSGSVDLPFFSLLCVLRLLRMFRSSSVGVTSGGLGGVGLLSSSSKCSFNLLLFLISPFSCFTVLSLTGLSCLARFLVMSGPSCFPLLLIVLLLLLVRHCIFFCQL